MRLILIPLLILLINSGIYGQCSCTDCPIDIISNATQSSFLDISGATNSTLGSNGQQLCQVCVHFFHDAVQEIDFILFSPSGSSVQLIEDTGIAVNDNITFDICFVSCDQSASPDSGFPDVFDSDAGYVQGSTYDGSYYPSIGCLEDLSGDVNGTWELEMTDNIFLDNGELFDWYLVFSDNTGTPCGANGSCGMPPSCLAEGGELEDNDVVACEGSVDLIVDFDPTFPNNNEAPSSEYNYTYVIINLDNDVIEDINTVTDLSTYPPGEYQVCGLSYLIADEPLIPDPDGSYEIDDLEDDIDDEVFCADLSDECVIITIEIAPEAPDFDGPTTACIDQLTTYEILDYDPDITYVIEINEGTFSEFNGSDGIYEIAWTSGPGQICAVIESSCGDVETCIDVEIIGDPGDIEIQGEFEVCPESTQVYTPIPSPISPEFYDFTVTNGTIIDQTDGSVTVEWSDDEGLGEICAELLGGLCPIDPICEEVEILLDYEFPDEINTPEIICLNTPIDANIPDDADIIDVIWTVTGLNIISGQGTDELIFDASTTGFAEICVEVISECAEFGPLCQDIEIIEFPEPEILELEPSCDFEFLIEAIVFPGNDYEWTVLSGPGNVDFDDDDQAVTFVTVDEIGVYTFQFTETNEANCEASDILNFEILNGPEISDVSYSCNIDMEYTASFTILTGTPPYTINGVAISDNTFTSDFIVSEESMEFQILDDYGCESIIEVDHECPCISYAGTMDGDLLIACADTGDSVQAFHFNDAQLDGDDTGIYILHDRDDDQIDNIFDSNTSGEFFYSLLLDYGVIYYISYVVGNETNFEVDLDDPCLSVAFGQPVIFYDSPQLMIESEDQTCLLSTSIEGTIPDEINSIVWTQLSGPSDASFSNAFTIPTEINFSAYGNYSFLIEYSNEACLDYQEIDIEVLAPPLIANIIESCGPTGEDYTLNFDVSGGIPPYTSSLAGNFVANTFISSPIPSGGEYQVIITDSAGCESNLLVGNKLCDCIGSAGNMSQQFIEICGNSEPIQAITVGNDSLDANDTSFYFLHTSAFNNLGMVLDSNTSGSFYFIDSLMTYDVIYYISFVVGDSIPNGIDLMDPCLDIAPGQAVQWSSIPMVNAGNNRNTCLDSIALAASPDQGFWTILSQPPTAQTALSSNSDPNADLYFDIAGDYIIRYSSSNGICSAADTITITKHASPIISDETIRCSDNLLSFDYEFTIGGGTGPYSVNGNMTTSNYSITELQADTTHDFEILSADGCLTTHSIGPVLCSCTSDAGTIDNNSFVLCEYESLALDFSNMDFVLDENDTLLYVLHDGDPASIGQILKLSDGSSIAFDGMLSLDTEYYISVIVGNSINNTLDFSDPCLSISEAISVKWIKGGELYIDDAMELCEGDDYSYSFNYDGPLPVELSFMDNDGNIFDFLIENNTGIIELYNIQTSTNLILSSVTGSCVENFNGAIDISITTPLDVELAQNLEICNNPDFGSSVALSEINSSIPGTGEWLAPGLVIDQDSLYFEGFGAGEYTISFTTIGFESPCPGNIYSTSITVLDCQCPLVDIEDNSNFCNSSDPFDLEELNTTGFNANWRIDNPNNLAFPPDILGNSLILDNSTAGLYQLILIIEDDNFPDICEKEYPITLNIEDGLYAGTQLDIPNFCESEKENLNLFEILQDEDPSGQWTYNGLPISADINLSDYSAGTLMFEYIIPQGIVCPSDTSEVLINLDDAPQFSSVSGDISCFGLNDGFIVIEPESENGESYLCYLNQVLTEGGKTIEGLSPGDYEIYLENENGCQSETVTLTISEPQAVTVYLGEDQEVAINDVVTIRAIVNIAESDIDTVSWEDLNGILANSNLVLEQQIITNNTINITILDENGCIASDQIRISVLQPEIYIPNIFTPDSQSANNQFGLDFHQGISMINTFIIYDRWGNKVFVAENFMPGDPVAYWNGYFGTSPAIQGVYVYYMDISLSDGSRLTMVDDVTLIR